MNMKLRIITVNRYKAHNNNSGTWSIRTQNNTSKKKKRIKRDCLRLSSANSFQYPVQEFPKYSCHPNALHTTRCKIFFWSL